MHINRDILLEHAQACQEENHQARGEELEQRVPWLTVSPTEEKAASLGSGGWRR